VTFRAAQALLPLVGLVAFLLGTLALFVVRCALLGRPAVPEVAKRPRTVLVKFFQEWWIWLYGPLERRCVRAGISPDALTLASTGIAAAAGIVLGFGHLSSGGWLYLFGASLDFVDGRVARATGRASRAGAFLDSTLDRVGELFVLGGLAVALRATPFLAAALTAAGGSVLVSYARARGEALGAGPAASVGGMQRPERVVLTGIPCALSPLAAIAGLPGGPNAFVGGALIIVAISSTVTAARRITSIYGALRAADPARPPQRRLASVFRLEGRRRDAAP
jgi:phosphatidylinositol phosphate synthase